MRKVVVFVFACMLFLSGNSVMAGEGSAVLNLLLKKGVITEAEYKTIMEELKAEAEQKEKTQIIEVIEAEKEESWTERITVSGSLEGEFRWQDKAYIGNKDSDGASDLYIRRLEVGIEAALTDWANTSVVLNSEWIGDGVNQGDEQITVDEALINIQGKRLPFYLALGKRAQPFGVFENHLITDPMTQDAYETKRVGLTAGVTGPFGVDVSATIYKGGEQMDHLSVSGLFEITRAGSAGNDMGSYIVSVLAEPVKKYLTLFGGFLSEPGRGKRNNTVNLGFNLTPPYIKGVRLDAEYMKALNREIYEGQTDEFREGVLSITASYVFDMGKRHEGIGGATFEERRTHLLQEPMEFAFRYERFDDDDLAEKTASWSAKNRYSLGVRYPFYRDEESGLSAYAAVEYRYTDYRLHESLSDVRAANNKEIYLKLGVSF